MSKSLGNVIDPFQVMDLYGTDALRYYLLREVSFGQDGSVSPEGFETRYATELANEYGNLASRTLAMIARYRDGVIPDVDAPADLAVSFDGLVDRVSRRFDDVDVTGALDEIWDRVRALNRFVQEQAPWQLAKEPEESARVDSVLYGAVEGLRVISVLVHPFIPEATARLLAALGRSGAHELAIDRARFGAERGGARIGELAPLFPRIERAAGTAAA